MNIVCFPSHFFTCIFVVMMHDKNYCFVGVVGAILLIAGAVGCSTHL